MANCKSGLGLGLVKFELRNREDIESKLYSIIAVDCDLSENEDYFREDTLELGYESEAHRLVAEAVKDKDLTEVKVFEEVFEEVFSAISGQEYFDDCDYKVEDMGSGIVMVAYAYGGNYSW